MKHLFFTLIIGSFIFKTPSNAQSSFQPFMARFNLDGTKDNTFNSGAYSTFLMVNPTKSVSTVSLLPGDPNISYLCGSILSQPNSPVIIRMIDGKRDRDYSPGFSYSIPSPKPDFFNSVDVYSAGYHKDKGVVLFGAATLTGSDTFFPLSSKVNERGNLDNFYREGGVFLLNNYPRYRMKGVDVSSTLQAGAIESYVTNSSVERIFTSALNGNNLKIGKDSITNVNNPIVKIYKDSIYMIATTKVTANASEDFKNGGITIAKFDKDGNLNTVFGKKNIPFTSGKFIPSSVSIENDKIYIAGKVGIKGIAIVKLNINGSLDESFGGDGISVRYFSDKFIDYGDMLVFGELIYITGSYENKFFIYLVNNDGSNRVDDFSFHQLHNEQGVEIDAAKIELLFPYKMILVGSGGSARILIAGDAKVKK